MLRRRVTVGQRFLNVVLHLIGSLFQFQYTQLRCNSFSLLPRRLLAFLGVDLLQHFGDLLHLEFGNNAEYIAVEVNDAALVFCVGEYLSHDFQHAQALTPDDEFYTVQTSPFSHWKKLTQLASSSFMPSDAPRTSRKLCSL